MRIELLLIGLGLLLLLETLRSGVVLARALRARRTVRRLQDYPSVSVIRPIRGLDAGAAQNIEAALDHGYPGWAETLFVFDERDEPALPLVERALADRRARGTECRARVIFAGPPPKGRTGKLNAMMAGLGQAQGELVAFADSDTRSDPDALRVLVETLLGDPRAGSAFAPVVVTEPPRTMGDAGYALLLNGLYGPLAAMQARRRGGRLGFIMGQFMVFRRQALDAIGGLQSAAGQLVDDMYLGAALTRAGYRNVVSPHPVPIIQEGLSWSEFLSVYLRWITFSRTGLPGRGFKLYGWLRGAVFFGGLLLAGLAGALAIWPAAALGLAASFLSAASISGLHRALGGGRLGPRHALVPALILLLGPWMLLRSVLGREVSWRGRSYALDADSRLDAGAGPERACVDCPQ